MKYYKDSSNPFVNATLEEIEQIENDYYILQIGADVFEMDGKMAFKKERAEDFYHTAIAGLKEMLEHGDKLEKEDAYRCLLLTRVIPLRIQ
jgi:hypothetical protein